MSTLYNKTMISTETLNDDPSETLIDLILIITLFGFVSCVMLVNYRLTYLKRTNSSKELSEDIEREDELNKKTIIESIMYDRTDL